MAVFLCMIFVGSHLGSNKSIASLSLADSFCSFLQIIDSSSVYIALYWLVNCSASLSTLRLLFSR